MKRKFIPVAGCPHISPLGCGLRATNPQPNPESEGHAFTRATRRP